jgi:hypothetical protein
MKMPDYRPSPHCLHGRRADVQEKSDEHAKASIVCLACRAEGRKTHRKPREFGTHLPATFFSSATSVSRLPLEAIECRDDRILGVGTQIFGTFDTSQSEGIPENVFTGRATPKVSNFSGMILMKYCKYCKFESAEKTLSVILIGAFATGAMPAERTGQCDRSPRLQAMKEWKSKQFDLASSLVL